jgi:hypothetical protein
MIYSWVIATSTDRTPNKARTFAFVAGGLLPDIPTYVFFFVHTFLIGSSQQDMWQTLYFDSAWSPIITLSHSLLIWPFLLLFATVTKRTLLEFFAASALLHVVIDFFVHNDDAYRHFWPLSDWKFLSPLSYYDPQYYGQWVGAIDAIIIIGLLVWLMTIYKSRSARTGIGIVILLYVASTILPYLIY